MKIAYVTRHLPVPSETFIINEMLALQSQGFDIHPLSLLPAEVCHAGLMAQLQRQVLDLSGEEPLSVPVAAADLAMTGQLAAESGMPPELARQAAQVAGYVRRNQVELLHAHFATESALVAMLAARVTALPFTVTAHAYDIFRNDVNLLGEGSLGKRLKLLAGNASRVITVSDYNRAHIDTVTERAFTDKLSVIHCGVDISRFFPVERQPRREVVFLSVGRFVEKKGHVFLLHAFQRVAASMPHVRLRLVGEGGLKAAMVQLSAELAIQDRVEFLGALSSEAVAAEMAAADIFALHSVTGSDGDKEGIPVSIMEAAATGLPVVATRHAGIPELVADGVTGYLTGQRDIAAFAERMGRLAASAELRREMGCAGRLHVVRDFDLGGETAKLGGVFRSVAAAWRPFAPAEHSVDIILPTYHPKPELLKRAINSILAQKFGNWRLILVQDGTDADIEALLRDFPDPRIEYHAVAHGGKPVALNFALSRASARYLAYLDDDDIWLPNHLDEAIRFMAANGIGFVHTDADEVAVSKENGQYREISRKRLSRGIVTNRTLFCISHINAVHERSLLEKAGLYDETRQFFIDWDMFLRLARQTRAYCLEVTTCEHYMVRRKASESGETISSIHERDPELSAAMLRQMFERSHELIDPAGFAELVLDLLAKQDKLEEKGWEIYGKNQLLTDKEQQLAERDQRLAAQSRSLNERDRQLVERDRQLAERDAQIVALNGLTADLNRQIAAIYGSLSWRLTKPLRTWGDLLLRAKRLVQQTLASAAAESPCLPSSELPQVSGSVGATSLPPDVTGVPTILLVSYYCPTRAHAGGLRILDIYALIRERYPQVRLVLYTHRNPDVDGSYDDLPHIFDAIYYAPAERLTLEWLKSQLGYEPFYDVVDIQFHPAAYDMESFRAVAGKIIYTPMESISRSFMLEMKSGNASPETNVFRKSIWNIEAVMEELRFSLAADETVCVSKTDAAFLRTLTGNQKVCYLETGISKLEFPILEAAVSQLPDPARKNNVIVFVAYFGSETNITALRWYLDNVHPLIKQQVADYCFEVVGRGDLSAFASYAEPSLRLVGEVPSLSPYIEKAKIGIAPALGGAGFRGKINQYAIFAVPSVVSPVSASGLAYRDGADIFVAATPELFARRCIELLTDNELNATLGRRARATCLERYSWDAKAEVIARHYNLEPKA